MSKKLTGWKTKGMNRDLSVSAYNPEFAFENINLRLSTNEHNTMLSWVNEKGPARINTDNPILGIPVGTAIINSQLVLFTHEQDKRDHIYVLKYTDIEKTQMTCTEIFNGHLGFDVQYPLETLVSYEAEHIQKVYWTDGINQPRIVNIALPCKKNNGIYIDTQFDFISELQLNENVKVKKILGGNGMFAPGVIQYAFTYYNRYGQESNIFYTSPLLYISFSDRGAAPDETVDNAFKITIEHPDTNFDYVRIYSIQRTSINATPFCKRVQDIDIGTSLQEQYTAIAANEELSEEDKELAKVEALNNLTLSYIDVGTHGESIDPTELLYKGGDTITAYTIEQKDNTLFLGNIGYQPLSVSLDAEQEEEVTIEEDTRYIYPLKSSDKPYEYYNQLTSVDSEGRTVPCGGFKSGDYYRLGVQFQYKTGKWSEPLYLEDKLMTQHFSLDAGDSSKINVPIFSGTLNTAAVEKLQKAGYKKMRGVVVFPTMNDRNVICQGVLNPTVRKHGEESSSEQIGYYQSSWFFRTRNAQVNNPGSLVTISPDYDIRYQDNTVTGTDLQDNGAVNPIDIRKTEIQGHYDADEKFECAFDLCTLHTPEADFDDKIATLDFSSFKTQKVGFATFEHTMSDINIQTETPPIGNKGGGFQHKYFTSDDSRGFISGLFYDDYAVDDHKEENSDPDIFNKFDRQNSSFKWLVYLWNKSGSLNNDINRPTNAGVQSAVLKKKVISNLRYSTTLFDNTAGTSESAGLKFFNSEEVTAVKSANKLYFGNIETALVPNAVDGLYFAFDGDYADSPHDCHDSDIVTPFNSNRWWKTFNSPEHTGQSVAYYYGFWHWDAEGGSSNTGEWIKPVEESADQQVGHYYLDLVIKRDHVKMKYKSSPHLVVDIAANSQSNTFIPNVAGDEYKLSIVEITRGIESSEGLFGGTSRDALMENTWIPCGEPVPISTEKFYYSYGDTYFQRWDCLKTYPFSREDENQLVEIGSFMLETRVNIDGRYDKNRGQSNNLNMSPQNFNLMNPIYSQVDNFFSYKIMNEVHYTSKKYPNQITWSKTKTLGADVDLWTNVTLASILEIDGDRGQINKLIRLNDQLLAFQDTGIAQILYNENVQIQSTEGVPIEIANSGKVQGKRYLSNSVGCSNKWSMATSPSGIYFMDSNDKSIYLFNDQLQNISVAMGFNTWCKQNIPGAANKWNPLDYGTTYTGDLADAFDFTFDETFHPAEDGGGAITRLMSSFASYYDRLNQEVLFINKNTALACSERLQAFTSFYDYGGIPYFLNLDDTGIWVKNISNSTNSNTTIWKHQAGDYCNFFGVNKPFSMTLIGNPEPTTDKIFTNLDFRACLDNEGEYHSVDVFDYTFDYTFHPVKMLVKSDTPFDSLETWNEYQHGLANLSVRRGHQNMLHHTLDNDASLIRKFRIWRCDIPRNNYNTGRFKTDRMRNPWLYLKLQKNAAATGKVLARTEIHDIVMTYFS